MPADTVVVDHPLVAHKLSLLRDRTTGTTVFRALLREVGMLLAFEATRDLPTAVQTIETPLQPMDAPMLAGPAPVLVNILRAGGGLVDGMLAVLPTARVGHVGLYRNEQLEAVEYYFKMPDAMPERDVLIVDPMLATAHTAVAATDKIRALSPRSLRFVCLLAAPEGLAHFHRHHPDVPVVTAAVDERLNEKGYILPGLGDAGDRVYGT